MERSILGVAGASGAALVLLAWSGYRAHAADRRALEELRSRVDGLSDSAVPARPAPVAESAVGELEQELAGLAARLARLERAPQREPVRAPAGGPTPEPESTAVEAAAAKRAADSARREFQALLGEVVSGGWDAYTQSPDAYQRFLELARETDLLDEHVEALEERVVAAPNDTDLRMELADAYSAKVMTAAGPEQGLWGGRAEEQWLAVVALDDGHWRAHSSLGTNYSYYPEVMGKTGDAILHLERTREIQRDLEPAPEHVSTYLFLARVYGSSQEVERAREVLAEGLQAHPGNAELEEALARLE